MGIAIGGGSISVAALIIAFVKWSLSRNVATEDKDKAKLEGRVEAQEKALNELRTQFVETRGEMRNIISIVSELRGLVQELKASMELGRDKQAQFYREELGKMEQLLRQDMTRAAQPELGGRVAELERAVAQLQQRRRR